MSESKVPLPDSNGYTLFNPGDWWHAGYDTGIDGHSAENLQAYGDARAAEARRMALLEALQIAEKYESAAAVANRLRALADEASPKQVSG